MSIVYTIFKVNADGSGGPKEIGEELRDLQEEVGGNIEPVRIFSRGCPLLIVNEEGRLKGLPDNKCIPGIVGDAFFIGVKGEGFVSLTNVQLKTLRTLLRVYGLQKGAV